MPQPFVDSLFADPALPAVSFKDLDIPEGLPAVLALTGATQVAMHAFVGPVLFEVQLPQFGLPPEGILHSAVRAALKTFSIPAPSKHLRAVKALDWRWRWYRRVFARGAALESAGATSLGFRSHPAAFDLSAAVRAGGRRPPRGRQLWPCP
jgi:hypothetical protein